MGNRRFEIALSAVFAAVVYAMIPLHEPWRDEAQAWLIARDLDIPGVLAQMRWELSTPLWHLLLWPFAHLGFPYQTAHFLNASFAIGTVAIVAFASPFARWQKLAFAGSFLVCFEYGVVARSYGMSFLFGVAIAALHPRRFDRPGAYGALLLGLALTNLHALVLALALGLSLAWELARRPGRGRALLASRWLLLVALGCAGLGVWAAASGLLAKIIAYGLDFGFPGFLKAGATLSYSYLSPYDVSAITMAAAGVVLIAALWQLRGNGAALIVFVLPVATYMLSPLAVRTSFRHSGFVLLATLIALWIDRRLTGSDAPGAGRDGVAWWRRFERSSVGVGGILVFGSLAATVPATALWVHGDVTGVASTSRAMARYIDENDIPDPIAAKRASTASALLPYLPGRRFWYLDARSWGTYVDWSTGVFGRGLSGQKLERRLRERFPDERPWLLSSHPLRNPARLGYELEHSETRLGRIERGAEVYFLYRPRYW